MASRPHDADEPADHPTSRAPSSAPSSSPPADPDRSGPAESDPAESGTPGAGTPESGPAGSGPADSDAPGSDPAGSGAAESGPAGSGSDGSDHDTPLRDEPPAVTRDVRPDDADDPNVGTDELSEDRSEGRADQLPTTPPDGAAATPAAQAGPGAAIDAQVGSEPVTEPTSDAEIDARWAEIVAQLGDLGGGGATARPLRPTPPPEAGVRADDTRPRPEPQPPVRQPGEPRPGVVPGAVVPPGAPRAWTPAEDPEEDHFLPPDPGPVLGGDPLLTMAWVVVAVVPVLLILAAVLWRSAPSIVVQVAGALFVAAVGVLVWRMPRSRDDDTSGPGAVV